ncbi:MAG: phosphatidate cytidylyltransferase [Gammaproteobacteria bacterium]|nr:phosphatidate cytidylyltransferase [Gammaproteobacteria bacterium]
MLRTRVITSVVSLLIIGIVVFVLPRQAAELVIGLVILAGAWEWCALIGIKSALTRIVYVAAIAALCALPYAVVPETAGLTLKIAFAWWFAAFLWTFFYPTPIPIAVRWIGGALVLVPLYVALVLLYRLGPAYLLSALLIVWAADAGAYFVGKRYGRVKLAPKISPGKTWEGVIGGLTVVLLLTLLLAGWANVSIAVLLPFCLAVAALSIIGDLTVSMFKRTAGVKDSGKLFPGHGGVLDRIDSVAAAGPLFALGLHWLGLIQ